MEVVSTVTNALIVGAVGLLLAAMTKGLRNDLYRFKADVEQRFQEVHRDIAGVRSDIRGDLAEVRAEIREVRSDLTQVALAVGARPRAGQGS